MTCSALGAPVMQLKRLSLISLVLWHGLAVAAEVIEVPFGEQQQWWKLNYPLVFNYEAMDHFMKKGLKDFEVEFAFTIAADGGVSDCTVVRLSDPAQADERWCEVLSEREYRPAKTNPQRQPIRTTQMILYGVSSERMRAIQRANAELKADAKRKADSRRKSDTNGH